MRVDFPSFKGIAAVTAEIKACRINATCIDRDGLGCTARVGEVHHVTMEKLVYTAGRTAGSSIRVEAIPIGRENVPICRAICAVPSDDGIFKGRLPHAGACRIHSKNKMVGKACIHDVLATHIYSVPRNGAEVAPRNKGVVHRGAKLHIGIKAHEVEDDTALNDKLGHIRCAEGEQIRCSRTCCSGNVKGEGGTRFEGDATRCVRRGQCIVNRDEVIATTIKDGVLIKREGVEARSVKFDCRTRVERERAAFDGKIHRTRGIDVSQ